MFESVVNENNSFYCVKKELIETAEKNMGTKFPSELIEFYNQVGYGFIVSKKDNINRIMGPSSVEEFYCQTGQFENSEEVDFMRQYSKDKLVFFEVNELIYISIGIGNDNKGKIYYYDEIIADNLEEFLAKYQENEMYFC